MAIFPGAIPTDYNSTSSELLSVQAGIGHAALHNFEVDEIIAIATKIGTGSSTPVNNRVLRGNGSGTSAWAQVDVTTDVTGTLPVNRGGTGGTTASALAILVGDLLMPIGFIYTTVTSTNPGTAIGFGTWTAFGAGKVLVGLDSGQTEFDTAEETGGAKTHTLDSTEIPAHTHTLQGFSFDPNTSAAYLAGQADANLVWYRSGSNWSAGGGSTLSTTGLWYIGRDADYEPTSSTGDGGAHNNLQPYIVVYMWKRTA